MLSNIGEGSTVLDLDPSLIYINLKGKYFWGYVENKIILDSEKN